MIAAGTLARRVFRWIAIPALLAGVMVCIVIVIAAGQRSTGGALVPPTGPYQVGRLIFDWTDSGRADPFAPAPTPRRLDVWIWYPTTEKSAASPYRPEGWWNAEVTSQGSGVYLEYPNDRISALATDGPAPAAEPPRFPVILMEPGMGRCVLDYTSLAVALASRGYVVVGINPTYSADAVAFLDGEIVERSSAGSIEEGISADALDSASLRIERVWVDDFKFVLHQLEALDADQGSRWAGRLALDRVGAFGHSFGGISALSFCAEDSRCAAAADIDGTPNSHDRVLALQKPSMFITQDYTSDSDANCEGVRAAFAGFNPSARTWIAIAGAQHMNFSDLPLQRIPILNAALRALGLFGPIDPRRAITVTNGYLSWFFDGNLKSGVAAKVAEPPNFPEARVITK